MSIVEFILTFINIILFALFFVLRKKYKKDIHKLEYEISKLKGRQKELLNTINDRNRIISIFYHHIKGPLNFLDILMEEVIDKSEKLGYSEINKDLLLLHKTVFDSYHMTKMVLLWVKNAVFVKSDLQMQDLSIIAEKVISQYKNFSKNIKIELKNELYDYHLIMVRKGVVEIILSNLLSNALRYAKNTIQIGIVSISANQIKLTVKDDGGGITDSSFMEKLNKGKIESFNLNRSDEYGTGIGLILVQDLAKENHLQVYFKNYSDGLGVEITFKTE